MAGTGKGATPRQAELGRRIREHRIALGLSQEGLANLAGIHRTYIGSLESGERNPSMDNLVRLAVALDLDPADLVRGLHLLAGRAGSLE